MMCQYCNVECQRMIDVPTSPNSKIIRHQCPSCESTFRFLADGGLLYISWDVRLTEHHYFIKIYDGVTGNAPTFVIYYEAKNQEGLTYWEEMIRWDFVPESWTPHNVKEKLKAYLPFL